MTLGRLEGLDALRPAIVVTGIAHLGLVESQLGDVEIETGPIVVEPIGRNTAPAVIAAALVADASDVLVILPSDHLITDVSSFQSSVRDATALAAKGGIVTFGIKPTRAETGYGYIEVGSRRDGAYRVESFKEKPGPDQAAALATDGRHFWNSGMFVARADVVLEEARAHCPQILEGVLAAMPPSRQGVIELGDEFEGVEPISFDYAIMEKTARALVIPLDVGWDDVGSYRSLHGVSPRDGAGNHISGDVTAADLANSFIRATSRRVVVAGVSDLIVVETPDAVLVLPMDRAQDVKDLQAGPDAS
jgi:mannose-1-phosphate guanylyltransferase/mannose-6-phosphate isomerase